MEQHFNPVANDIERKTNLEFVDEKSWRSEEIRAKLRLPIERYFNRKVSTLQSFVWEMVMRRDEFPNLDRHNKFSKIGNRVKNLPKSRHQANNI